MKNLVFLMLILLGCDAPKNSGASTNAPTQPVNHQTSKALDFSGPPTLVYRTKGDYFKNVPIILSEDKTIVVSYPAPSDVYYNGKLAYPKRLDNGYLLDNRGINQHVVFLKWTYEEYSKLSKAPSVKEMMDMIIDNDPLIDLFNCGNRHQFTNEVSDINELIKNNFPQCQKIK